jgi:hypothetical protein
MRFDARQDRALVGKIKIFLDGKEVHRCFLADEEAGYIERYGTTRLGRVSLPVIPIRETGIVRIERISS